MAVANFPLAVILDLALVTMVIAAIALAFTPQIADLLIRFRARRLPAHLSERFSEEWIATVVVLKIPRVMGTLNLSPPTSATSAYR